MYAFKKYHDLPASYFCYPIAVAIAIMLGYAAISKLLDYSHTKSEMMNQIFPRSIALQLAWLVPLIELIICGLLLFKSTQLIGFCAAALLMTIFSLYISITMTGIFGRIPCSCGGILGNMGYHLHLLFNLFFLLLSLAGIAIKLDL